MSSETEPSAPARGRDNESPEFAAALDRARRKAYWRLLPLLFLCYVIAYVDRSNVAIAKLTMTKDLPYFDNAVFGFGAGLFFWGYFLLEIPCSLLVEKWSARRLLCRIMVVWGIAAALTACVRTPFHFYIARFLLGLGEAGFFPGVIVFLTHWFPAKDRSRALSCFLIATPVAQITSPKISNALLKIGSTETFNDVVVHHPMLLGLKGWQWVYILWGIPAVILGLIVFWCLTDRPAQAKWLTEEEKSALETQLEIEKKNRAARGRMKLLDIFSHPQVLLLACAYFCSTAANYTLEFFLPSLLQRWYSLKLDAITWLVILPPCLALAGQLFVGWNADRTGERRLHAVIPISLAVLMLALAPFTRGHLFLTTACFMVIFGGIKAYQPAFWSLPSLFLTDTAAAGSIGLINSLGNLGGFFGPSIFGLLEKHTRSFTAGIYGLCFSLTICATIILLLGIGRREPT
ncbi:MAG TPA: MFS transporter [Candidatus Dormibacteraeota bacterium]|nr:MFS transporter [Candidatus Dormibacteraeota bacterium]